jgi:phage shock protein E
MSNLALAVKRAALAVAVLLGVSDVGAADVSSGSASETSIKHVSASEAQKLMVNQKVVVLDLRTPEEFQAGHIAGATNIDFLATGFEQRLANLDKSKIYLVHCASGNRSTLALPAFKKLHFQSLYHLDGGFKSWEKGRLPAKQ